MNIELFEPYLARENDYFRYLYRALIRYKNALLVSEPRPLPRLVKPREHSGAWARFDGHLVFFDFSDHVFLYDTEALKQCDVYFKANLHRGVTLKVLEKAGSQEHESKILPFVWFAPNLGAYRPDSLLNRLMFHGKKPTYDVCHIVGVYENYLVKGEKSVFASGGPPMDPARYHFWMRYHVQQALRDAGVSGYYRLTSRGNRDIEDNKLIFPNLSERKFMQAMVKSRFTMINTLPHALLPWKASESLMLGRPFIVERSPLVEMPEPFQLRPNVHYLEMFPGFGDFDDKADIEDPRSYRILDRLQLDQFQEGAEKIAAAVKDRELVEYMTEHVRHYSATFLSPGFVADFVCGQVKKRIH
jgi:hypothetical protein